MEVGYQVENLPYTDANGVGGIGGAIMSQSAKDLADTLDTQAVSIGKVYFKTPGGGVRGSIITTLYLIAVSLLIALPLGIAAAIYLHEYAKPNRLTSLIRSAIEMLTGVPSIIFGLMGVAVLFPITQLFGATTTNNLLGSYTAVFAGCIIICRRQSVTDDFQGCTALCGPGNFNWRIAEHRTCDWRKRGIDLYHGNLCQ